MKIIPVEFRVLIKPLKIEETDELLKSAKTAGIVLPEDQADREQMAQQKGTLINRGGNAFIDWKGEIPNVGDTVMFAKYAGYNVKDGEDVYRVLNDKDISAIIREE